MTARQSASDGKLGLEDPALKGKSIEELIVGALALPAHRGARGQHLEEQELRHLPSVDQRSGSAPQAKTCVGAEDMVERLQHPYGLELQAGAGTVSRRRVPVEAGAKSPLP